MQFAKWVLYLDLMWQAMCFFYKKNMVNVEIHAFCFRKMLIGSVLSGDSLKVSSKYVCKKNNPFLRPVCHNSIRYISLDIVY